MSVRPLRVLHVSPYFAPAFVYGGPPRSILGLCQALVRSGVDVDVFTTTANGRNTLPPSTDTPRMYEGVRVRYFPLAAPRWLWHAAGLRAALAREIRRYDLVHIHGLWNLPAWHAARLARRSGVPYVVSPRGMLEREALNIRSRRKTVAFRLIEDRNLRSAAFLHATSRREAATLGAAGFGRPIVVAPNGIDPESLISTNPLETLRSFGLEPDQRGIILFLGRIHPIKRLDLLAVALARLRTREVRIVIAGSDERGHRAEVEPLIAASGVPVTWTGAVDAVRKAGLLASARALVMCSDSESFGLSVAEAMACGVPVVVTDTCGWQEVELEGAGRSVPQDPAAIAEALDEILTSPSLAAAMGARGRALVARRYTWSAAIQPIVEHYLRATGHPSAAQSVA